MAAAPWRATLSSPRRRSPSTGARRSTSSRRRSSSLRPTRRPGDLRAVQRGALPGVLQGVRRPAHLGRLLAHDPGHQQPAVLEVVRRRQAQRLLQLRRPPPGRRARNKAALIWVPEPEDEDTQAITYQELYTPGQRVRRAAAGLLRPEDRRPGDVPPADGPRAAGLHAGLRPARRHPLGGVRRVQRRGVRRADRRLAEPHPGDDGRLLPQRRADRPQGQGRRGGGDGQASTGTRSTRCWSGAGTRGQYASKSPMVDGPRLLRRRGARGLPRRRWSSRCRCRPRRRCS